TSITSFISNSARRQPSTATIHTNGITDWFDVEPVGRIYLDINFGKKKMKKKESASSHRSLPLLYLLFLILALNSSRNGSTTPHGQTRPRGRRARKKGRNARNEWPPVPHTPILPHHEVRSLQRIHDQSQLPVPE